MAVERQLSYDEDEEIARLIEEFDNIDQKEEEIRQHNEIVHQEELYKEHIKTYKERCYLMEIQKYIIEMFELNLRFNNAQSFDEKQKLFQEQIQSLAYIQRLQRDLLEVMSCMTI